MGGPPAPFRMPVERLEAGGRSLAGRIAQGEVRPGDAVRLLPAGVVTTIRAVRGASGALEAARAGDAVTVELAGEVPAMAGDILASADHPPECADQFEARLAWTGTHRLLPGRTYRLRILGREVPASVTLIKHREDPSTGARLAARTLGANERGVVNVSTGRPIVFEPYAASPALGAFVLLDPATSEQVATGIIDFALRRASNIHW